MKVKLSPARRRALKALHRSRRGRRVNNPGVTPHQLAGLFADVSGLISQNPIRGVISVRVLAEFCGVSDRSVRRWLDGINWPASSRVRSVQRWLRRFSPR